MTIIEITILSIFAASLAANILYVIFNRQMSRFTLRWDLFRWISAYQLFTESPRNFRLFFRDKLANDVMTVWTEVALQVPRKWYHLLLFPENLIAESVYSFADDLVRLQESKKDQQTISRGFKYRTVLLYISRFPKAQNSVARQFKIEEMHGFFSSGEGKQVFISEFDKQCIFPLK